MTELTLSHKETDILKEEVLSLRLGRSKQIRKGLLISGISLFLFILSGVLHYWFKIYLDSRLISLTYLGVAIGIHWSVWWWLNKSVKNLQQDLKNRTKIQDESIIKSYSHRFHTIKLQNGFKLDFYDLTQDEWEIGDVIRYQYTPNEKYILETDVTER